MTNCGNLLACYCNAKRFQGICYLLQVFNWTIQILHWMIIPCIILDLTSSESHEKPVFDHLDLWSTWVPKSLELPSWNVCRPVQGFIIVTCLLGRYEFLICRYGWRDIMLCLVLKSAKTRKFEDPGPRVRPRAGPGSRVGSRVCPKPPYPWQILKLIYVNPME